MIDKHIEIQFVNRAGVYLTNFKQVKPREWSFSHTCETASRGKKLKSRGRIYQQSETTTFNVKCFHCGFSVGFETLLKDVSSNLHNEYRLSGYRENTYQPKIKEATLALPEELVDVNLDGLLRVIDLPPSSPILDFIARRHIPRKHYKLLYVARHFYQWATQYKPEFVKVTDDSPRLVIPYFNNHGKVIGFTGRTFNPTVEPRYVHLRIDKTCDFIYGTERVDPTKTIYVTEGQIDSLFLDNAIAVGGAYYNTEFMHSIKTNCVIIPDSDWKRNAQVAKQLKMAIKNGFSVCFMPDTVDGKDLNDIVKNGMSLSDLKCTVDSNIRQGLAAMLEFAVSKRC